MEMLDECRSQGERKVCNIKSLYCLIQEFTQQNIKLIEALIDVGFAQSNHDYSLFNMKKEEEIMIILVYVDDLLITGSSMQLVETTKRVLYQKFKVKDLGELKYFFGT